MTLERGIFVIQKRIEIDVPPKPEGILGRFGVYISLTSRLLDQYRFTRIAQAVINGDEDIDKTDITSYVKSISDIPQNINKKFEIRHKITMKPLFTGDMLSLLIQYNQPNLIEIWLENGPQINKQHWNLATNFANIYDILMQKEKPIEFLASKVLPPLFALARIRSWDKLKQKIQQDESDVKRVINEKHYGQSLIGVIVDIVDTKNVEIIRLLFSIGAHVNTYNGYKMHILTVAISTCNIAATQAIYHQMQVDKLDIEIILNEHDKYNKVPLDYANDHFKRSILYQKLEAEKNKTLTKIDMHI